MSEPPMLDKYDFSWGKRYGYGNLGCRAHDRCYVRKSNGRRSHGLGDVVVVALCFVALWLINSFPVVERSTD